jgi:hypothetical protein
MNHGQVASRSASAIMSDTTPPSSVNGPSEPVSSLSDDIENIRWLLSQDIPEDAADQDIGASLQQLERADSVGQNVEGRMDAILEKLDSLLGTLQPDEGLKLWMRKEAQPHHRGLRI